MARIHANVMNCRARLDRAGEFETVEPRPRPPIDHALARAVHTPSLLWFCQCLEEFYDLEARPGHRSALPLRAITPRRFSCGTRDPESCPRRRNFVRLITRSEGALLAFLDRKLATLALLLACSLPGSSDVRGQQTRAAGQVRTSASFEMRVREFAGRGAR